MSWNSINAIIACRVNPIISSERNFKKPEQRDENENTFFHFSTNPPLLFFSVSLPSSLSLQPYDIEHHHFHHQQQREPTTTSPVPITATSISSTRKWGRIAGKAIRLRSGGAGVYCLSLSCLQHAFAHHPRHFIDLWERWGEGTALLGGLQHCQPWTGSLMPVLASSSGCPATTPALLTSIFALGTISPRATPALPPSLPTFCLLHRNTQNYKTASDIYLSFFFLGFSLLPIFFCIWMSFFYSSIVHDVSAVGHWRHWSTAREGFEEWERENRRNGKARSLT